MTKEIELPKGYCSSICKNSMNEICVENCAIKKDMSAFELKKGVELPDLPPFPLDEFIHTMTPRERQNVMAVYMAKTVDFIQGRKEELHERPPVFPGRSSVNSERNPIHTESITGTGLYPTPDGHTVYQDRGEDNPSQTVRSGEVSIGENAETV